MDHVRKLVARAAWRMTFTTFLRYFLWAAFGSLTVLALCLLADRTCYIGLDARLAAGLALGVAALIGGILTAFSRTSMLRAALALDERACLQSRFASALEMCQDPGPMVPALIQDAEALSHRVNVGKAIPIHAPRRALLCLAAAAAVALGVWAFVPQCDLLRRREKRDQAAKEQEEIAKQADELKANIKRLEKVADVQNLEVAQKLVGEVTAGAEEIRDAETKPEALAKLAELTEKVKAQSGPGEELKKMLESLEAFAEGDILKDFVNELKEKDLKGAAQALRKLEGQLQKGEMSQQDMAKLAKELGKLSQALKADEKMSQALEDIAKNLLANKELALEKMKQVMGELKDKEKMAAEMELMDLALVELTETKMKLNDPTLSLCPICKEKLGRLCPAEGPCDCDGGGVCASCAARCQKREIGGGMEEGVEPGKGGVSEDGTDANTALNKTRIKGKLGEGEVLGSLFVRGTPKKGEALVEYSEIVKGARDEAADALSKEEIPLGYKGLIKGYFDSIEPGRAPKAEDAPKGEAKPAEKAKEEPKP